MANSRQKILAYIKEQGTATVDDLSRVFHVTQANIRHHLSILLDQGSIVITGQRPAVDRGRPSQIYASSQQNQLHNLDQLAGTLLASFLPDAASEENRQKILGLADRMAKQYLPGTVNPTRRLYTAIRNLNRMNYQAHWEAHIENPRIMLGHCPYYPIIGDHPELCRLDACLLEALLDAPVKQVEKLNPTTKGLLRCIFLITPLSS